MDILSKFLMAFVLVFMPPTAFGATVTLNGKIYNDLGSYLGGHDDQIIISAQLNESVTKSFALFFGNSIDKSLSLSASAGATAFRVYEYGYHFLNVQNNTLTGFTLSNGGRLAYNQQEYMVFDLTFSPTTETLKQDSLYSLFPANQFAPGTSLADIDFAPLGLSFVADNGGYILDDLFSPSSSLLAIGGTVLPNAQITPVPLLGAGPIFAMGLMGLIFAGRRKKI